MMRKNNCYILTGGPGSGKSSVIRSLQGKGYSTVEESGRKIIKQQIAIDGDALPWANQIKFCDLMLQHAIENYKSVTENTNHIFFDRGIVDIVGYTQLIGRPISDKLRKFAQAYRYNKTVFIFPPWEEIYEHDSERKQDFDEAIKTYHIMQEVYRQNHYELIEMPKVDVEARVAFILKIIKSVNPLSR